MPTCNSFLWKLFGHSVILRNRLYARLHRSCAEHRCGVTVAIALNLNGRTTGSSPSVLYSVRPLILLPHEASLHSWGSVSGARIPTYLNSRICLPTSMYSEGLYLLDTLSVRVPDNLRWQEEASPDHDLVHIKSPAPTIWYFLSTRQEPHIFATQIIAK